MMYQQLQDGWIEIIVGCMFAGKTEELIRRIKVLQYAKKNIVVIKPRIDNRYSEDEIASHSGYRVKSVNADNAKDILRIVNGIEGVEVVAIDEAQFFDKDLVLVCEQLADSGKRVILAGLDRDFRGEPFGVIPELLTRAEFVTKLSAVCAKCGRPATRTQRVLNGKPASYNDPVVLVGAKDHYEPRCRHCHEVPDKPVVTLDEDR